MNFEEFLRYFSGFPSYLAVLSISISFHEYKKKFPAGILLIS